MTEKTDLELFTIATAKLEKVKAQLLDILSLCNEAGKRAKAKEEWNNFQTIQHINAAVHGSLSGANTGCAVGFDIESGQIQPRTGGGGK